MTIRSVETIVTSPGVNYCIVKITTDDGIVGYGDATYNGRVQAVNAVIDDYLADYLKGHDADRIEDIWQMVFKGSYWRGGPVLMTALAGIDMALWDIKGKRANMPLYSLLGGKTREKVLVYHHAHGSTPEMLVERCRRKMEDGLRVLRYSFDTRDPDESGVMFRQPHQDVELGRIEVKDAVKEAGLWDADAYMNDLVNITKLLRAELGDDVGLIHDVHGRLTAVQAARVARELEPYHLFFLEDPVDHWDTKAFNLIRSNSTTPIAIGELYTTFYDCADLLKNQSIDYTRVDISHFGGISAIVKHAAMAYICGVKAAFHGPSDISPIAHAAMLHVNYAIPNFGIQENVDFSESILRVFDLGYKRDGSYLYIGDKPGLGIKIDEEEARKHAYKRTYMPILRDKTGALHNW